MLPSAKNFQKGGVSVKRHLLLGATLASVALCGVFQGQAAPTLGISTASIGGKQLNVLAMTTKPTSLSGSLTFGATTKSITMPALAQFSVTQMMPPAPVNYVPPTTTMKKMAMAKMAVTTPSTGTATGMKTGSALIVPLVPGGPANASQPAAQNLEIAAQRPDFSYHAPRLEFQPQSTHTTGQNGMGVGPGLPLGTSRYVPVGEF